MNDVFPEGGIRVKGSMIGSVGEGDAVGFDDIDINDGTEGMEDHIFDRQSVACLFSSNSSRVSQSCCN